MKLFGYNLFGTNDTDISLPEKSLSELRDATEILFVDDNEDFKVVDIFKTEGWRNTKLVSDVEALTSKNVRDAHVIFVDIGGVGKELDFDDEGLGLVIALKHEYPDKKVIVYSAHTEGDRFHSALRQADATIRKNAEPYEFMKLLRRFSKQAFSTEERVKRFRLTLKREFGIDMNEDQVRRKLSQLSSANPPESELKSKFGLNEAGSVASLLSIIL